MSKIAYFDCYSGASGDMLLGAMLDTAIDFDWFLTEIEKLHLPQNAVTIEKTYVQRSSIKTCKVNITQQHHSHDHDHGHSHHHEHHHRGYTDICQIIEQATIDEKAKTLAKDIFLRLATAEADIHQTTIDKIHFHEVGALDAIVDIVGFSICYTSLNIDKCVVSPIPIGMGTVKCAHGCIPVPAPAVVSMLKDRKITIKQHDDIREECLTPTATAILTTIANECTYLPDMDNILSVGYGAGDKVFTGNVVSNLRFIIGEKTS